MLKNYFKIAWRNLEKNKFFSAINISGLAIGLAVGILLLLWVQDELSFDGFHKNGKNIFHATARFNQDNGNDINWGTTPAPLATFGKKELPEVVNVCRVSNQWTVSYLEFRNQKIFDIKPGLADTTFFRQFSFILLSGNIQHPFPNDHSIILSESVAKKIFRAEDPIGKTLTLDDKSIFKVSGIMKDPPTNSAIQYNVLFDFNLLEHNYDGKGYWKSLNDDWGNYNYDTYFQLRPGANPVAVGKKLADIHRRNQQSEFIKNLSYILQPLPRMHLYSIDGKDEGIRIVRIFFLVAIIVLMIACINYTNLVTARATKRAKEISMRKIVGARKTSLFWQFLNETFLILVISLLIATLLIYLVLPLYNDIAGKQIVFRPYDPQILVVYGCTFLIALLMAGIYPALTLSSFKPIEALKGKFSVLGRDIVFRKFLVIVQFIFSVVLIVTTVIIGKQLKYLREKNLGYDKTNVLTFGMRGLGQHCEAVKAEIAKSPGILGATWSGGDLGNLWSSTGDADWDGKTAAQQSFIINQMSVDPDFISVLNLRFKEGRGFTGTPADSTNYVLNEEAVKEMGLKDPVGKRFTFHDKKGVIVGVLKDFHFKSLHVKIEPIILFYQPEWRQQMYVKTTAKDASRAIASLTQIWKKYNPDYPFNYTFMDDNFDQMYRADLRVGKLFNCFATITIFISCLGLFGLVTYTAESKVKEIGVRKVLGASVPSIVSLMSKDFMKLVFIATALAFPIAWWALHKMLEDYAYKAEISAWVFIMAGCGVFLIAWITIGFQAIKTALANPIASLRTE